MVTITLVRLALHGDNDFDERSITITLVRLALRRYNNFNESNTTIRLSLHGYNNFISLNIAWSQANPLLIFIFLYKLLISNKLVTVIVLHQRLVLVKKKVKVFYIL